MMKDWKVSRDGTGIVTGRMRRIGGWGSELKKWWAEVKDMIRERVCAR